MNIAGIFALGGDGNYGKHDRKYYKSSYSFGGYYGSKGCCEFGRYNGYNRSNHRDERDDDNGGLLGFLLD